MRALIVGGGVAGPVLGMFLRRVGVEAIVCEQRIEGQREEGAFLGVAPNGMNVLAQLGLERPVQEAGEVSLGFAFLNTRGEPIGAIDGRRDRDDYGAPMVMIKRGVLQHTVSEAARGDGVRIELGKRLTDIEQGLNGVLATFADGTRESADCLIGADGLRSRTRALVFPDAPAPSYTGLIGHGGFVRARGDEPLAVGTNTMVFGKRAFFGAFLTSQGEVWWFHNAALAEGTHDPNAYGKAQILEAHRGDPAWIQDLVERTPDVTGPWPAHDILSLPRWHHERVCLIGDAAHAVAPSGGQGASLALEDTIVLARCLREQADPPAAFAAFEAARRQRVEWAARESRRNGSGKAPTSAAALWLRDRMMPLFLKFGAATQRKAFSYRPTLAA